ncbi:rod shape-determining-related protein [Pseudoalteromonas rubra]|uniref:rod shape-determining-related protein n=1 Tax=Pseudoalteromonas rubra TaxID=43658 RepID=UPI00026CBDF4|nr:rod shape-determining-related protein [Pseudoalteromonas rubra]
MFWIKRHLYYQVTRGQVTATFVEEDKSITKLCSALNHPKTLMGNFMEIEDCFRSIAKELTPRRFLWQEHTAIVHLLESVEGGYISLEIRAFREAAFGAGAREVLVPNSNSKLTKAQTLNRKFTEWDCV